MTELRKLVSDKKDQEAAMIQVGISDFNMLALFLAQIQITSEFMKGLDADGART